MMYKSEVVKKIAGDLHLTQQTVSAVLERLASLVVEVTSAGEKLDLTGFGVFEGQTVAPIRRLDFHTGELTDIPARNLLRFRPSKRVRKLPMIGDRDVGPLQR